MANNKMLIDASHPEETRVAVVRGNRIEEFDFESQAKRQLRGNIYLAKVTRVEPSLQAAFVDYGGNRHGFLAFNEIHPDYYQIPTADRQALLDEEAMAAEEDGDGDAVPVSAEPDDEADEGGKKKKRTKRSQSRGKRGRKAKDKTDEAGEDSTAPAAEDEASAGDSVDADEADAVEAAAAEPAGEADDGDVADEAPQQAEIEAADEAGQESAEDAVAQDDAEHDDTGTGDENDEDEEDRKGGSIAAIVETDSISEPAPEDETPDDVDDSAAGDDAELKESVEAQAASEESAAAEEPAEAEAPKKPRRRTTRRKPAKAAEKADDAETADADPAEAVSEQAETEAADPASDDAEKTDAPEENGDRPSRSRRSTRGRRRSNGDDENGDDDEDEKVESVGSEDALEEVPYRRKLRRQYKIQEVVKRRQVMLVQVVKEERGNKGAALTTYLSLAGRYSVLMPNTARGGGISRKITNANDRKRLKSIAAELDVPSGMGVILRTAGASRTKAEIKRDFEYLMRLWENVRNLTLTSNAPCLVYEEGSLIKRSIRDLYDKNIGEVLVSGDDGYREAKEFMRMLMPSHAKNVKQYDEDQAIFSRHGVEQQLERLLSPQVTLKSGGYLVINQTEALVSIDVNSGRSTREHSIEDTALATNLEAAEEIARQLRLRDLAGLIVIDFIDMEEKRNNRSVEKRLKEALKSDRARIQVGRVSHFGLLEMSRQRIRASVIESTMEVCPHCQGTGHVRSDSSIALHIFRAIEDHAMRHSRHDVVVRCPTVIAIDILNTKRAGLIEIEQRLGLQVQILADASLPGQSFNIEKGEPASGAPSRPAHVQMDSAPPLETELDDEADALAAEPVDDGDDDDGGRKKRRRRRGKRGGRRNRGDAAEASDASAEADSDESEGEDDAAPADVAEEAVAAADDAVYEAADDSPAETEASDVEVAEAADNGSEATAEETGSLEEEPADEEPAASPRGRNTRRPRKTARTADDDNGGGNGSAEEALTAEVPSDATDGGDDGSKRSGWWNRGGGFF